jgi:hypothetical protein
MRIVVTVSFIATKEGMFFSVEGNFVVISNGMPL